jgi:pilus assembly protein CpaC
MRVRELLALIMSLVMVPTAGAQDPVQVASVGGMNIEDLRVTVSKSLVIDYPADINRISTSNPEIVDAVPATSREFLLHGKGHGSATVVVWAKNGMRTMYNVTVEHNLDPIKRLLKDTFPSENIGVVAGRDSITLVGTVSNKEVIDRAVAIATPLAKTVVSNLAVPAAGVSKQILLKVRFAELDRTMIQQFGVNLVSTGAGNTVGSISTQQFSPPTLSQEGRISIADALNVFAFRPDLNLAAFVKALQGQGVLQILAEPNLVTTNGKAASFLVGGEFPVPVLQGGANAGAVTIQFREFGIRLTFDPLITDNDTIKLYVKPEVSTIDLANAVTFSGFTIPALATRRMETNIELAAGQSFVIAGLIDDRVTETFNKLPGLANIPILGSLFRSRSENRSKSELVIIVTPEVATPINAGDPKPEPAWLRQFLPEKRPGDKVGTDLVPGTGGAVVPPLPPGRVQVNRDSVGNGAKLHSSSPQAEIAKPPADVTKRAKDAGVGDDDPAKRSKLKFWGRKPASAKQRASGEVHVTPAGERPLQPAVEAPAARAEAPRAEAAEGGGQTQPQPAPLTAPVETPTIETPAPQRATPVDALREAKPETAKTAESGRPATLTPGVGQPAEGPEAATGEMPKPAEVRSAPAQAVPASEPVDTKPAAAASVAGRRAISAGITSLPLHVLSAPAASPGAGGPARGPGAGERP